jgi:hypothetical protein
MVSAIDRNHWPPSIGTAGRIRRNPQARVVKQPTDRFHCPEVTVREVGNAHLDNRIYLTIDTVETGFVVFHASEELLRSLKESVDRVLTFTRSPASKN